MIPMLPPPSGHARMLPRSTPPAILRSSHPNCLCTTGLTMAAQLFSKLDAPLITLCVAFWPTSWDSLTIPTLIDHGPGLSTPGRPCHTSLMLCTSIGRILTLILGCCIQPLTSGPTREDLSMQYLAKILFSLGRRRPTLMPRSRLLPTL